ncbi:MAG: alpha/beta hydrolase-fold protein [Micrococcaceae bacterium]|nr:alpha/beta hydrolase-fold protein [Micrococcaceae bacterium]
MYEPSGPNNVQPINIPDSALSGIHGSKWLASWWLASLGSIACFLAAGRLLFSQRKQFGGGRKPTIRFRAGSTSRISGIFVLVMAAGGFLVNAYASYVPNLRAARRAFATVTHVGKDFGEPGIAGDSRHGAVSVVRLPGDSTLRVPASNAWIYTPPAYDGSGKTRYPILYLIHGYPGSAADWFVAGETDQIMDALVAGQLVEPMIVVSLDINGSWQRDTGCLDAVDGPRMESWLYGRVLPFFEKAYPIDSRRTCRILGGVSAGGYCALDQGLRHQEIWGTVLSFEGYGDPGRGGRIAFKGDQAAIRSHSPSFYLPTITFMHPQAFYLDSGDRLGRARVRKLADLLAERQQMLYYRINRGEGHSWSEVRAGLPYALIFASREFPEQAH